MTSLSELDAERLLKLLMNEPHGYGHTVARLLMHTAAVSTKSEKLPLDPDEARETLWGGFGNWPSFKL